jgi:hypothetical protein
MGADEARTVRDLKGRQAVVLPMVGEFAGDQACPQPVEADIRPLDGNSRFDPQEICATHGFCAAKALFAKT